MHIVRFFASLRFAQNDSTRPDVVFNLYRRLNLGQGLAGVAELVLMDIHLVHDR